MRLCLILFVFCEHAVVFICCAGLYKHGQAYIYHSCVDLVDVGPPRLSCASIRALFKMADPNNKTFRKLASFAQEKLWHESALRPTAQYEFEPGFETADCIGDFGRVLECDAVDKAFEWYRRVYGSWYEQNQAYTVPGMEAVVRLINQHGAVELNQNLDHEDAKGFRLLIDEMLVGDSRGDSAWFNTILNSEKFSEARDELRELKALAEKKKLEKEQSDRMAASAPAARLNPVDQAIADNTYSMSGKRVAGAAPLPRTEYHCVHCGKKLFLTRVDVLKCDVCGCGEVKKPHTK